MNLNINYVDSFTNKIFSGNPAAVCVTENPLDEFLMQKIAAEINLSETAFLYPKEEGYHLRWFTPKAEVSLCGHATLASAHILWEKELEYKNQIYFYTLSGKLSAQKVKNGIELDFPVELVEAVEFPKGLIEALKVEPVFCGKTKVRYFAELSSSDEVRNLKPDLVKLQSYLPGRIVVTACSDDPRYDFISRYFAPGIGIPEDPVTGSTHCVLADYWATKLNKTSFSAYQASERGGGLLVRLEGNRVKLIGRAVSVMSASLVIE